MTESTKSTARLTAATCMVVYAPNEASIPNNRDSGQATRLGGVMALVTYSPEQAHLMEGVTDAAD